MEPKFTFTRSELIKAFELWNDDVVLTDDGKWPSIEPQTAEGQMSLFIDYLSKVQV